MRIKILLFSLLLSACWSASYGQEPPRRDTIGVKVYFRQGYSTLEPSFRDNASRIDAFARKLAELRRDTLCRIHSIRIVAFASPEGSTDMNNRLSEKRARRVAEFMRNLTSLPESLFEIDSRNEDWQGLIELVEESDMPYRDEVLDILYNTPIWVIKEGKVVDGRKRRLGMLRGGRAWNYMLEHFFPDLRGSQTDVICEIEHLPVPVTSEPDPVPAAEPAPVVEEQQPASSKPFCMALKSNLLYDAALVPNIGVEFCLGKGWTIGADWMYAWWRNDKRHRYWRVYGGDLDIRKYFGRRARVKPLTGHHLGLYGQILTYDFETGGKGYIGGKPDGTLWDKMNWGVGLEYGYSLPVGRRLNFDFGIGIGYMGGEYWEYEPVDSHYVWQQTKQRHWFGPTKAEISLVWLIGRGNYNEKKGGKR